MEMKNTYHKSICHNSTHIEYNARQLSITWMKPSRKHRTKRTASPSALIVGNGGFMETKYIVSWSTPGLTECYKQFATREGAMKFANDLRDLNRADHCLSIFVAKVEEEIQ